jgi:hypothetical protein
MAFKAGNADSPSGWIALVMLAHCNWAPASIGEIQSQLIARMNALVLRLEDLHYETLCLIQHQHTHRDVDVECD